MWDQRAHTTSDSRKLLIGVFVRLTMVISGGFIVASLITELVPFGGKFARNSTHRGSGKCILKLVITDRPDYYKLKRVGPNEKDILGVGNFSATVSYSKMGKPLPHKYVKLRLIDARTEFEIKTYKRPTNLNGEAKFHFKLQAGYRYRIEAVARNLMCG